MDSKTVKLNRLTLGSWKIGIFFFFFFFKWSVPIKRSYDAISCFAFSMECYKLIVHRQDLKSQNQRDILYQS